MEMHQLDIAIGVLSGDQCSPQCLLAFDDNECSCRCRGKYHGFLTKGDGHVSYIPHPEFCRECYRIPTLAIPVNWTIGDGGNVNVNYLCPKCLRRWRTGWAAETMVTPAFYFEFAQEVAETAMKMSRSI